MPDRVRFKPDRVRFKPDRVRLCLFRSVDTKTLIYETIHISKLH